MIALCLEVWGEVIGPVPDAARIAVERYVRSGHGEDVLNAIGWSAHRDVRTWRYVEHVLWNRSWEQPPPGHNAPAHAQPRPQNAQSRSGAHAAAIAELVRTR